MEEVVVSGEQQLPLTNKSSQEIPSNVNVDEGKNNDDKQRDLVMQSVAQVDKAVLEEEPIAKRPRLSEDQDKSIPMFEDNEPEASTYIDVVDEKTMDRKQGETIEEPATTEAPLEKSKGANYSTDASVHFKHTTDIKKKSASPASESTPTTTNAGMEPSLPRAQSNKKQSRKNKHKDPRMLDIRRRLQLACRDNDLGTAIVAYEEAIDNNIEIEAQSFYNLLNLCDGLGKSIVHVGTPKATVTTTSDNDAGTDIAMDERPSMDGTTLDQHTETSPSTVMDLKKRLEYAFQIKDRMTKQNLPLNETAYSAIIKLLCKNKEFEKAEEILDEAESVQQCKSKLRLYSSLLTTYCDATRVLDALRIWKRLKGHQGLVLTEKELLALMRCAIVTGDSLVMEYVLTELAEEVPVPSKDTVAAIIEWFGITHSKHTESLTNRLADTEAVKQLLLEIGNLDTSEPPPTMGPVVNTDGWQISSACQIEHETGKLTNGCLAGCQLKPVPLSAQAVKDMIKMNEAIVFDGKIAGNDCQFQGGRKGKKRGDFSPESRRREWDNFVRFLDGKETQSDSHRPFDVVIDGANIGYHQQNFSDAPPHIDYNQLDWMIRHFQIVEKQKVLVVMHSRHFSQKMLPQRCRPLYESWMKEGLLYKTPFGMNDDWFWMHAALKYNLLVVSNDEMRDHHFQMLAPRSFLRWKERQQVHFGFGSWEDGPANDRRRQRQVILEYPAVYSRRIQKIHDGFVVPLAKRGDDNRFLDGSHFASEDEPNEETYLCICPKASATDANEKNETNRSC